MSKNMSNLAINGGPKAVCKPLPNRGHFGEEEKAAVNKLFDEAIKAGAPQGYNGPHEEAFCKQFAEFMGGGYADAVNSCSNAVYVALRALEVKPFSEVIVGPITDPGGFMPVVMCNCIPVVPDTAPGKYNTDAEQIEKMITPLTGAIIVAHIAGEPTNIDKIVEMAHAKGIPVIEDCAQAHYAKLNGKLLGTFGDIAAFSTMNGKHFCTGGQGGVVYTKSEALYWKARQYSDRGKPFGIQGSNGNVVASINMNLNDLQAVIGSEQLKKLPDLVTRRQNVVRKLTEKFKNLKSVKVPEQLPGAEASYWFWRLEVNLDAITCKDKFEYLNALRAEGVPVNPEYRAFPHLMDWYKNRNVFPGTDLPWSAAEYTGEYKDKEKANFPVPNALAAISVQYNLSINESWDNDEVIDMIYEAYRKVDEAFAK
jgi:perosamine synthetase